MRNLALLDPVVCSQHDPELWHDETREEEAIRLCLTGHEGGRPCPGLAQCADIGTDPANRQFTSSGVWGGMGERKRALFRAHRARVQTSRDQTVTFPAPNCQTHVTGSSL